MTLTQPDGFMTARIFIVHDDPTFSQDVRSAFEAAGHTVAAFDDPMVVLDALVSARRIELLITQANFGPGKLNGIALGRMARVKQPNIRVLFTAVREYEGIGRILGQSAFASSNMDTREYLILHDLPQTVSGCGACCKGRGDRL